MKYSIMAIGLLITLNSAVCEELLNGDTYTDKYDELDIDEILHNERIFNNYFYCLKTGEKCTAAGTKLRELLPDALQNKCARCTEVQKDKAMVVLHFVAKHKPEKFKELEDLFDKERKYRTMYSDFLEKEGVVLPD